MSFAVTYGFPIWSPRIAYLKEQAKLAGLELTLNLVDGSSAFKYILEKKHDLAFLNMGGGEIPAYWEYLHSKNVKPQTNNHANYSSPALDAKIDAFKSEFDVRKRYQISHTIQKMVTELILLCLDTWSLIPRGALALDTISGSGDDKENRVNLLSGGARYFLD